MSRKKLVLEDTDPTQMRDETTESYHRRVRTFRKKLAEAMRPPPPSKLPKGPRRRRLIPYAGKPKGGY